MRHIVLVLALSAMSLGGLAQTARAETSIWESMTPGANSPGLTSLQAQCNATRPYTGWTAADCAEARQVAAGGQCQRVSVPDGIVYASLTGRSGAQGVTQKALGATTPALWCTLSNGQMFHWYTGFRGACNNLAILAPPERRPLPPAKRWTVEPDDLVVHVPGLNVCGCIILPSITTVVPGGTEHHFSLPRVD